MARLKIKNVGPIKEGLRSDNNNGFIEFRGITVFIGNQGSGKSTIAKIYSTLSWIEKALIRGDFTVNFLLKYNRFKKQLEYQNIHNYLNEDSYIEYEGKAFKLLFQNNSLEIVKQDQDDDYNFPKIMYVPAERNFVSSVDRPDLVKRLPLPLYTFLDEYEEAKQNIREAIKLPIGNIKFEYRKQNKKSMLIGDDFRIDLLKASSGFQSLVPLFLVTQHLSKIIENNEDNSHKEISVHEENKIRKEVDKILENKKISEDVKRIILEKISSRFKYSCFINIVEEPEQNLYPVSQKDVLFELFKHKNSLNENNLVITTHSPYIINYLTLAIKAGFVKEKIKTSSDNKKELLSKLTEIVPIKSTINADQVNIYQLTSTGSIKKLSDYNGIPSDENYLNEFLADTNELYDRLIDIEEEL